MNPVGVRIELRPKIKPSIGEVKQGVTDHARFQFRVNHCFNPYSHAPPIVKAAGAPRLTVTLR